MHSMHRSILSEERQLAKKIHFTLKQAVKVEPWDVSHRANSLEESCLFSLFTGLFISRLISAASSSSVVLLSLLVAAHQASD